MSWLLAIICICLTMYLPYLGQCGEITAQIHCFGPADIFVDGQFVNRSSAENPVWTGNLPGRSRFVAVRCETTESVGAFGAFFQYLVAGDASKSNWKCGPYEPGCYNTRFNDSHWTAARAVPGPPAGRSSLPAYTQWLRGVRLDEPCRKRLEVFVSILMGQGGRVFVDGHNKAAVVYGQPKGFLMPWATRVIAVASVSNSQGLSFIGTSFSNGVHTRVLWKCTNNNYTDWNTVGYNDTYWGIATDYEPVDLEPNLRNVSITGIPNERIYCRGHIECGCEHLCQVHNNGEDFHCLCPTGLELAEDGFACESNQPLQSATSARSNVTDYLENLLKIEITSSNVEEVASDLVNLTGNPGSLQDSDVILAAQVIEGLSEVNQPSREVGQTFVGAVNNLLQVDRRRLEAAQRTNNSASRIVMALERYSLTVNLEGETSLQIIQGDIAMQAWDLPSMDGNIIGFGTESGIEQNVTNFKHMPDIDYSEIETAIIISEEVQERITKAYNELTPRPENIRLAFCLYKNTGLFVSQEQTDSASQTTVNSEVVALKVANVAIEDLTDPILTIFKPQQDVNAPATCVFWDFNANEGKGNWSGEGCTYNGTVNGRIKCLCNHLTNFAVLMDTSQRSLGKAHKTALTVITYIGLGLSTLGLIVTILTFLVFRKRLLWRNGQKVLVNLAVALLCVNIIFLAGIEQTSNKNVCIAVAALLHYFLLVAFAWMLVEAVLHYLQLVKVIGSYVERFMLKTSLPAWFIPTIPVLIIACTAPEQYRGSEEYCWLKKTTLYFAFMLPVGVIVLINAVLYIRIMKSITCDRPDNLRSTQSRSDLTKLQLCSSVCIFVLLGLTWAVGFLAVAQARIIFQYIFCILNTLQGFLIFLCHTLREKKIRDAWCKLCFGGNKGVQNVLGTRNGRENRRNQSPLLLENSSSGSQPKTQAKP